MSVKSTCSTHDSGNRPVVPEALTQFQAPGYRRTADHTRGNLRRPPQLSDSGPTAGVRLQLVRGGGGGRGGRDIKKKIPPKKENQLAATSLQAFGSCEVHAGRPKTPSSLISTIGHEQNALRPKIDYHSMQPSSDTVSFKVTPFRLKTRQAAGVVRVAAATSLDIGGSLQIQPCSTFSTPSHLFQVLPYTG